jgi:hypothetical protein
MQHIAQHKPCWSAQETRGQPLSAYGREITPIGRLRQVRWPGGGLAWHRPAAIEVRQGDEVLRLPIVPLTRRINAIGIAAVTLATLAGFWLRQRRIRERSHKR